MERLHNIIFHLGRLWLTCICLVVTAWFAREAFQAENGLPALRKLASQKAAYEAQHDQVKSKLESLQKRVQLMDADAVDPDMLEEQVRDKLGFVAEDEVILLD